MDELALRTLLKSLEASRSSLHVLLHCFTWAVVVGLGLDLIVIIKEFWDDWKEFRYGQVHPYEIHLPKRPSVGLLVLGLLGTALIVIGVAGELYVDVQAGKIETQIREVNDNLLGLIIQEAGDAATSAKIAHDEVEAVAKEADEIEKRLVRATNQLGNLESKIRAQGPRFVLLVEHKTAFVKSLAQFTGQPVTVVNCGGLTSQTEPWLLGQFLFNLLRDAKWGKNNSPGYTDWGFGANVTGVDGITIVFNSGSDAKTKAAADALNEAFADVPLIARKDSGDDAYMNFSGTFFGADSPWAMAAKDHSQLFVLVGPNLGIVPAKKRNRIPTNQNK